jgi:hypothetical protein
MQTGITVRVVVGAAIVALCGAAAGCGGGGEGTATEAGQQATAGRTTTVDRAALEAKAKRLIPIASQSQAVASKKESLRIANAQSELLLIAQKDPAAIGPLTAALKKQDYDLILDMPGCPSWM